MRLSYTAHMPCVHYARTLSQHACMQVTYTKSSQGQGKYYINVSLDGELRDGAFSCRYSGVSKIRQG